MLKHLPEGMSDEQEKLYDLQFSSVPCVHIGHEIEEINGTYQYQSVLPIRSGLIYPISSSLSESMESVSTSDLLYFTLLYFTLLYFTLLYFTYFYFISSNSIYKTKYK